MEEQNPYGSAEQQPTETLEQVYCPDCGAAMAAGDRFCGACRWDAENPQRAPERRLPQTPRDLGPPSNKNRLTTLLLCVFGGYLGLHRFYAGRAGSGVLWLVTFGLFTVGWVYDMVMVATGEFVDDQEKRILYWE